MVYRYEWANNQLINPTLLMQLSANPGETGRSDHNGGKVAIGPDGNIYAGIGEVGPSNQGTGCKKRSSS
jgi:aldose sugar dehydrogenase